MIKATQGKMCGILIVGSDGNEQAIPYTSVWKMLANGEHGSSLVLNDAASEGSTGDYGRIRVQRDTVRVELPLSQTIDAFRRASRGDVVDISDAAIRKEKNKGVPLSF